MLTRFEPWEPEFNLATMTIDESGLALSLYHNGLELAPNPDWFFRRSRAERDGQLAAFSIRTFIIPLVFLVIGVGVSIGVFVTEVRGSAKQHGEGNWMR